MLSDFDFDPPPELIAQKPLPRGKARLLHWKNGEMIDRQFENIVNLLQSGDVLVLNDTRVIPAFLQGKVENENVSINLITRINGNNWEFLSKPRKKIKLGSVVKFSEKLSGVITQKFNSNDMDVIQFNLEDIELLNEIEKVGKMPLPPYIKRTADDNDNTTYQTVFSKVSGSVAAPTAGLHFTDELLSSLAAKGVKITYITLHVGGGTFLPVRVKKIDNHKMHYEFYSISNETCDIINGAKSENRRVIAVGTTVTRTLESAAVFCKSTFLTPHSSSTNLFIKDRYKLQIVNGLITNFHLPKSTLFILVCTFLGGVEYGQKLYQYAIKNKYRFFSYGDACLLVV